MEGSGIFLGADDDRRRVYRGTGSGRLECGLDAGLRAVGMHRRARGREEAVFAQSLQVIWSRPIL